MFTESTIGISYIGWGRERFAKGSETLHLVEWWRGTDQFAKRIKTHEVRPKGKDRPKPIRIHRTTDTRIFSPLLYLAAARPRYLARAFGSERKKA